MALTTFGRLESAEGLEHRGIDPSSYWFLYLGCFFDEDRQEICIEFPRGVLGADSMRNEVLDEAERSPNDGLDVVSPSLEEVEVAPILIGRRDVDDQSVSLLACSAGSTRDIPVLTRCQSLTACRIADLAA